MIQEFGNSIMWMGVVEDINDPVQLGRVRVRIFGTHTEDKNKIKTKDLPWAQPIQSINSGAVNDLGTSPTGLKQGSWVVGFFMDGNEKQRPLVFGSLAGVPDQLGSEITTGFSDPDGVYPNRVDESDVNRLARDNGIPHPVLAEKESARTKSVKIATPIGGTWDEPASTYAAKYTDNHVMETEGGHIREYDDTTNAKRIHEWHDSGTFYEIDNEGNKVVRIVKDSYEIVAGNEYVKVKGNVNLTVDGNCNMYVEKDWNVQVGGNWNVNVGANWNNTIGANITESAKAVSESFATQDTNASGTINTTAGGAMALKGATIDLN